MTMDFQNLSLSSNKFETNWSLIAVSVFEFTYKEHSPTRAPLLFLAQTTNRPVQKLPVHPALRHAFFDQYLCQKR